ncbi:hypothetical protein [Collinsella tanakaei]|nr:hypothetical protein [Collinsella tanakaei]
MVPASRAMVAAMLHNLELAPEASSPEGFEDVDASCVLSSRSER